MIFSKHLNAGAGLLLLAATAACSGRGDTIQARAAAPMDSTTASSVMPAAPDAEMQAVLDQLAALHPKPIHSSPPPRPGSSRARRTR